jgi:NAD(P)-dependent dehydrogenase (short-subunit alcohol dehydrogenase family)
MDLGLTGQRALVTGASKGIGAAIAEALAAEGCAQLHLAARDAAMLNEVAARLRATHAVSVAVHPTDLRQPEQLDRLARDCGELDLLVNNAGDIPGGTIADVDSPTWRRAWDLKVLATIDLSRLVYAAMKARGAGVIVNIIGAAGERFPADYITGASGNAALMGFTRALGGSSLNDGIRVVGVNPGPVGTGRIVTLMRQRAQAIWGDAGRYPELMRGFPLGRAARPAEIADVAVFLASARASYLSGTIVTVDGGAAAGAQ